MLAHLFGAEASQAFAGKSLGHSTDNGGLAYPGSASEEKQEE